MFVCVFERVVEYSDSRRKDLQGLKVVRRRARCAGGRGPRLDGGRPCARDDVEGAYE